MQLDAFITKWSASEAAERANKDAFLYDLCDVLQVPRPDATTGDRTRDLYVFERDVVTTHEGGKLSVGKIDLYKHGCFVLEAKQGSNQGSRRLGSARRGTPGWSIAMRDAFGQALGYARLLDQPPPFIVTCDIGHCFELYACFDGTQDYRPFPDAQNSRLYISSLGDHLATLKSVFLDPFSLDPSRYAARVTREVAGHLAELARALEDTGNPPEKVAAFLMRCIFTMFAEDVDLLQGKAFTRALEERWLPRPSTFKTEIEALWQAMKDGTNFGFERLLRFNGGLFADPSGLNLTKKHLEMLVEASRCDWADVEPAIFGTLVERALDPRERHALGAHYTPRAYVERLIRPTIEEPLRQEWAVVQIQASQQVEVGKLEDARDTVRAFHQRLRTLKVLDPACGSGNFLYVTLDLFKRLEVEVLRLLSDLGDRSLKLGTSSDSVTPDQFLGIEVNPRAKAIAELVLWIGFLQWHFRTQGSVLPSEPVLKNYGKNIECRDAVLAYDGREAVLDATGQPVTRWDGVSLKKHPVTGEDVPDETKREPVYRYLNPRKAEWMDADYIVGNPPFIGAKYLKAVLGDGYAEALRKTWPEVPESSDLVTYWWENAASLVRAGKARRFGLITTNSISQSFGRRVTQRHLEAKDPLSLLFAIPDHPWSDTQDGADVRIAMTVGAAGQLEGRLLKVVDEQVGQEGVSEVTLMERIGIINADLKVGPNVAGAHALGSNSNITCRGVVLHGSGFIVSPDEAKQLGLGRVAGLEKHIRPYLNGRDVAAHSRNVMVIDVYGLSIDHVRSNFPEIYQCLVERVKPERDVNPRESRRLNWWLFGESVPAWRRMSGQLSRYITTVATAKHRFFVFLDGAILPDDALVGIASSDAFILGVLSSRIHVTWALAAGGRLGIGNDPRYNKGVCFDKFPFPAPTLEQQARIRALGEMLDAHRKRQQALHPDLTLTGMYNVLETLRSGQPLDAKEKVIHEKGLVSLLKQLHDDLDGAVFAAYGWPVDLTDEQILERLVALNAERVEEERQGQIRWLRPEFQNPGGQREATQTLLPGVETETAEAVEVATLPWPKKLPEQVAAVRDRVLKGTSAWDLEQVASAFKGARRKEVADVLDSMATLGMLVRYEIEGKSRWKAARMGG